MILSIIIVTYNSSEVLKNCLDSVRRNSGGIGLEVIIVDNNSNAPGEQEKISLLPGEYGDLPLKLIQLSENSGFGAANNRGAEIARGKYLLILNPDTVIEENVLSRIIGFLEKNPEAGAAGPKLMNEEKQVQEWSCGPRTSLIRTIKNNFGLVPKHLWQADRPIRVNWVSGAALMVPKAVFEKVGGFDEKFFMYFEDEDLGWRIEEAGYKVYYLGNIELTHLCGQSSGGAMNVHDEKNKFSPRKQIFYRSQDYFFEKHYGALTAALVKLMRSLAAH